MKTTPKPREGGIQYWPSDWTLQCEALCRKTGLRCPHTCSSMIPSTIAAGSPRLDDKWFTVQGKPASLCRSHWLSWHARSKRLLSLPLIRGGHLTPANKYGYGSIIIAADRIDFTQERPKVKIPTSWGWIAWKGNVPDGLLDRLPPLESHNPAPAEP